MKNIFSAITILCGVLIFGQNTSSPIAPSVDLKDKNTLIDFNKVYEQPDEMPDFPEGILVFRTKFQNAIALDSFRSENGEGNLKGLITFVVERDGTMTDLKVTGSNEKFNAEVKKAVRSIKEKWKPGKIKGETVRSRYRIPLTINIS